MPNPAKRSATLRARADAVRAPPRSTRHRPRRSPAKTPPSGRSTATPAKLMRTGRRCATGVGGPPATRQARRAKSSAAANSASASSAASPGGAAGRAADRRRYRPASRSQRRRPPRGHSAGASTAQRRHERQQLRMQHGASPHVHDRVARALMEADLRRGRAMARPAHGKARAPARARRETAQRPHRLFGQAVLAQRRAEPGLLGVRHRPDPRDAAARSRRRCRNAGRPAPRARPAPANPRRVPPARRRGARRARARSRSPGAVKRKKTRSPACSAMPSPRMPMLATVSIDGLVAGHSGLRRAKTRNSTVALGSADAGSRPDLRPASRRRVSSHATMRSHTSR